MDLADNDSGTAMFNTVTGLMPGATENRCIDVTYTGTVDPTAVLLYSSGAPTGTLAPYLDLTVEVGADTGAGFRDCTGFVSSGTVYSGTLAGFHTAHGSYGAGATTWDPAATSCCSGPWIALPWVFLDWSPTLITSGSERWPSLDGRLRLLLEDQRLTRVRVVSCGRGRSARAAPGR